MEASAQSYQLRADEIEAHRNEDVLIVSFACLEDEDEPNFLVLQRNLSQSAEASQAIYLELNDQSASCYGGIVAASFGPEQLSLTLDAEAAEQVGLGPEHANRIRVGYELDPAGYTEIRDALQLIFSDHADYRVQGLEP